MQIDIAHTDVMLPQNTSFGKIEDGSDYHFRLGFLAMSQSPMNIFVLNLVHKQILAIHCLYIMLAQNINFGKIQDGGSHYLGCDFLPISQSPMKLLCNLVCR